VVPIWEKFDEASGRETEYWVERAPREDGESGRKETRKMGRIGILVVLMLGQRIAAVGGWEIWGARGGDQDGGAGRDAFVAAFTDGEGSGVGEDADVGKLWNGGSEGGSSDPEHGSGEAELSDEVGGMGDQDGQLAHT